MKPIWRQIPLATWTALLATLAALLLTWSPPSIGAPTEAATPVAQADDADIVARLKRAQDAVLGVQVLALDEARSNRTLGQARQGSGVVIGEDGLVLTIGYLLMEADRVVLRPDDGRIVPARVLGYDTVTGLGLVQALAPLRIEPVPLGRADALAAQAMLMVVSGGEGGTISLARLAAARPFTGYWEYHLDQALYTVPARPDHSGAGLFNQQGELVGVGSLLLQDVRIAGAGKEAPHLPGNLFVPAQLLPPILAELRARGTTEASRRAWLGINCMEHGGVVQVMRVNDDSPADVAGLQAGDRILGIDGTEVASLSSLWQRLWDGQAQREVVLDIQREGQRQTLKVHSVERALTLRRAEGI